MVSYETTCFIESIGGLVNYISRQANKEKHNEVTIMKNSIVITTLALLTTNAFAATGNINAEFYALKKQVGQDNQQISDLQNHVQIQESKYAAVSSATLQGVEQLKTQVSTQKAEQDRFNTGVQRSTVVNHDQIKVNTNDIRGLGVKVDSNTQRLDAQVASIGGDTGALHQSFEVLADRELQLEKRMDVNEGKLSNGIAGVAAMSSIPMVSGQLTVGAGVGYFNSSEAIAVGISDSFDNGLSVKTSLAYAQGKYGQNDMTVGAGVGYSFN